MGVWVNSLLRGNWGDHTRTSENGARCIGLERPSLGRQGRCRREHGQPLREWHRCLWRNADEARARARGGRRQLHRRRSGRWPRRATEEKAREATAYAWREDSAVARDLRGFRTVVCCVGHSIGPLNIAIIVIETRSDATRVARA